MRRALRTLLGNIKFFLFIAISMAFLAIIYLVGPIRLIQEFNGGY